MSSWFSCCRRCCRGAREPSQALRQLNGVLIDGAPSHDVPSEGTTERCDREQQRHATIQSNVDEICYKSDFDAELTEEKLQNFSCVVHKLRSSSGSEDERSPRSDADFGLSDQQLKDFNWMMHKMRAITSKDDDCISMADSDFGLSDQQLDDFKWTTQKLRSLTMLEDDENEPQDSDFGLSDEQLQRFNWVVHRLRAMTESSDRKNSACSSDTAFGLSENQLQALIGQASRRSTNMAEIGLTASDCPQSLETSIDPALDSVDKDKSNCRTSAKFEPTQLDEVARH